MDVPLPQRIPMGRPILSVLPLEQTVGDADRHLIGEQHLALKISAQLSGADKQGNILRQTIVLVKLPGAQHHMGLLL